MLIQQETTMACYRRNLLNIAARSAKTMACAISVLALSACAQPPISAGTWVFQHRFAEHPQLESIDVLVEIHGNRVQVFNHSGHTAVFPAGKIADGKLLWHPGSGQGIIASDWHDRFAQDVGACSDGPEVIDLHQKIYWTC